MRSARHAYESEDFHSNQAPAPSPPRPESDDLACHGGAAQIVPAAPDLPVNRISTLPHKNRVHIGLPIGDRAS